MSDKPKERNEDSKKAAENNIEQPEPVNKQDPTQPVEVGKQEDAGTRRGGKAAGPASTGT
jgi:hypothetical protein